MLRDQVMDAKEIKIHKKETETDKEIIKLNQVYIVVVILLVVSMVAGQALLVNYGVM